MDRVDYICFLKYGNPTIISIFRKERDAQNLVGCRVSSAAVVPCVNGLFSVASQSGTQTAVSPSNLTLDIYFVSLRDYHR